MTDHTYCGESGMSCFCDIDDLHDRMHDAAEPIPAAVCTQVGAQQLKIIYVVWIMNTGALKLRVPVVCACPELA